MFGLRAGDIVSRTKGSPTRISSTASTTAFNAQETKLVNQFVLEDETNTKNDLVLSTMTAGDKLKALRDRMKELDLDVYIVPTDDPHLSGKNKTVIEHNCC